MEEQKHNVKSLETMGGVLPMTALLGGSAQQGYLSQASVTLFMKGKGFR